jgi:hypothetical protein
MNGRPVRRAGVGAVLVVAVLLGASGVGMASRHFAGRHKEPVPKAMPVELSEVRTVEINQGAQHVDLQLERDGSWTTAAGPAPALAALMSDMEGRLFPLLAYRAVRIGPSGAQFGPADAALTLAVEALDGERRSVALGAQTFTGGGVYARRSGDPDTVYLVPRRMVDDLRSLLAGRRIDAANDIPQKVRDLSREAAEAQDSGPTSYWLQQVLDADATKGEGAK